MGHHTHDLSVTHLAFEPLPVGDVAQFYPYKPHRYVAYATAWMISHRNSLQNVGSF